MVHFIYHRTARSIEGESRGELHCNIRLSGRIPLGRKTQTANKACLRNVTASSKERADASPGPTKRFPVSDTTCPEAMGKGILQHGQSWRGRELVKFQCCKAQAIQYCMRGHELAEQQQHECKTRWADEKNGGMRG